METVTDWIVQNIGVSLQGVMYLGSGIVFAFGFIASVLYVALTNHGTGRDFMTGIGLTAVFTGLLYLGATFVPTLLG